MENNRDTITKEVVAVIAEQLNKPVTAINTKSTFEELGLDSLDRVELVMKLEEQYGIEMSDQDAESLHTIDQVVDYLVNKVKKT